MSLVQSPSYKFGSLDLGWYVGFGKLYQLLFTPSKSNIIASHGIHGRLAGGCLGSYLDCMN